MARVKLNSAFKGISGRVGDVVFYSYGGSQYMRRYVVPNNPDTRKQQNRRELFATAVAAWQTLPDYKKKQWEGKAALTHLPGYQFYISMYMNSGRTAVSASTCNDYKEICPSSLAASPFLQFSRSVSGSVLHQDRYNCKIDRS